MTLERPVFPPRDSSRRAFLNLVAGTSVITVAGIRGTVTAQAGTLPGSDAMLDASTALAGAFAAAVKTKRAYDAAEAEATDWEARNPQSSTKHGKKKWWKRATAERERLVSKPWQELLQAERDFMESQAELAAVPIVAAGDLQTKIACAHLYDCVELVVVNRAPISRAVVAHLVDAARV